MHDGESARIPKYAPAALDEAQRSLYDAIAGGRRAQGPQLFRLVDDEGRLEGPFNAFLLQPGLGGRAPGRRGRGALRDGPRGPRPRDRDPRRRRRVAVRLRGLRPRGGRPLGRAHRRRARRRSARRRTTSSPTRRAHAGPYRRTRWPRVATSTTTSTPQAVEALGLPQLFEVLTLVGYYATLALQLRVFRVAAPEA